MTSRLAFQTQLASIMEVLANAAVAEICKLVDDDYALVSLQMSQCQRENKALRRKLHLLELKMARGTAERRLRETAMNSSRPRVQLNTNDSPGESSPSTTGKMEQLLNVWYPTENVSQCFWLRSSQAPFAFAWSNQLPLNLDCAPISTFMVMHLNGPSASWCEFLFFGNCKENCCSLEIVSEVKQWYFNYMRRNPTMYNAMWEISLNGKDVRFSK